ncbi:MAG TPA: NAD-dependent epimerase/dehydratase family protein [Trueperaceae bacterium]
MRILVTGAHGFIGSHLCERLLSSGFEVRALVSPWGDTANLTRVEGESRLQLVRADVTDAASLAAACEGAEAVIHAAAKVGDWGRAADFERTNVEGTRNLLEAARWAGTSRFVLVSSIAVHRYVGFREADAEAQPRDNFELAYARSKILAEDLVFSWSGEGVVVRPGLWPFGPRDPQLRRVAAALAHGALPLLDGGRSVLNTAYVENLVQGLELAATESGVAGRAFVIADDGMPTWSDVLGELARLLGAPPPRLRLPSSLVSPVASVVESLWSRVSPAKEPPLTRYRAALMRRDAHFSIGPARRDLGYEPLYSWQEGLALSVANDPALFALSAR